MTTTRPDTPALCAALEATCPGSGAPEQHLWLAETDILRGDGKLGLGEIYTMWPVLHVMTEIWEAGGIDAAQRAVMDRIPGPKAGILARIGQARGGVCFVAVYGGIAVVQALLVEADKRQKGVGARLLKAAAVFAHQNGASHVLAPAAPDNAAANALFQRIGMELICEST